MVVTRPIYYQLQTMNYILILNISICNYGLLKVSNNQLYKAQCICPVQAMQFSAVLYTESEICLLVVCSERLTISAFDPWEAIGPMCCNTLH